jgi:mannitol 2-dehydrogenase
MRIASEGTAKLLKFIVPTIEELGEMRKRVQSPSLTVAAWLLALCGKDEKGRPIAIQDASASFLSEFIRDGGSNAKIALSAVPGFAEISKDSTDFAGQVQFYLDSLRNSGVRATLEAVIVDG